MRNFIGLNVSTAQAFANENNINLNIKYVEGTQGQFIGQILSQDIPEKTDLDNLSSSRTLTVTVVDSIAQTPEPVYTPEEEETPTENEETDTSSEEDAENTDENGDNTTEEENSNTTSNESNTTPETPTTPTPSDTQTSNDNTSNTN